MVGKKNMVDNVIFGRDIYMFTVQKTGVSINYVCIGRHGYIRKFSRGVYVW